MTGFLRLVSVENTKLWKRISTKIMIFLLIGIVVGILGVLRAEIGQMPQSSGLGNWKTELQQRDKSIQQSIDTIKKSSRQIDKSSLDSLQIQVAEDKYRISHNIPPENADGFWNIVMEGGTADLIALLAIIAGSALVAGEFSEGTMKTMITRPFSRWQILTAKFLVTVLYALVLCAVSFLTVMGSVALFFGTGGIEDAKILWMNGVLYVPGGVAALIVQGFDFLEILVYIVLAFAISATFRSRSLATGVSIFLMVGGTAALILGEYFSWGKYILFADTGFSVFLTTGAPFYGITLGSALLISAVYSVIFLFIGYVSFAKRDIS